MQPTLRASLSGTFLHRKDVVNQCLEFACSLARSPRIDGDTLERSNSWGSVKPKAIKNLPELGDLFISYFTM